MTKNRALILTLAISLVLACSISLGAPPSATPAPTITAVSTFTEVPQDQIATFVAQTVEAQQPAATEPPPPTEAPSLTPMPLETAFPLLDTQWNGRFRWFGTLYPVTFVIQDVNRSSFIGAMYWSFTQCKVTERTEGDVILDITSATEQERWRLHPDYQSGDLSGTWLRWTQNESIGATRCYLTISGDWWYGHIRSDGHMVGIHFTNSTNKEPDTGATFDFTMQ